MSRQVKLPRSRSQGASKNTERDSSLSVGYAQLRGLLAFSGGVRRVGGELPIPPTASGNSCVVQSSARGEVFLQSCHLRLRRFRLCVRGGGGGRGRRSALLRGPARFQLRSRVHKKTLDWMLGRNSMSPRSQEAVLILFMLMVSNASGAFVGINIGTQVSNIPSASDIVSILKAKKIQHVRLFDSDHQMLVALANTGIEVMVGVPNDQLLRVGQSRPTAADWVNKNVAAYLPATNITYIAVGNEVLTTIPNAALVLVPALQFLQSALLAANLNTQVKLSSPHSTDMIAKAFPPSTATFNSTWSSIMSQYLQFLKSTGSTFMLNAQPYYGYVKGQGIFPLEYALFRSLNPNSQIADPNTNLFYTNMFDAMVDATYNSMKAMNFTDIPVMVTASGWPSHGGRNEPAADVDNALAYNGNLIRHVLNNSGTPSQPTNQVSTYLFELFNEDLRAGPDSEKNWGIMFTNASDIYSLTFEDVATNTTDSPALRGMFCVANPSAPHSALKQSLDWACGPGSANCSAIQPGQPCYKSDDIVAVASYAFNDYYHRTQASGGTCNFNSTATMSSTDPSHGSCIFAGSNGANGSDSGAASGPASQDSFASQSQSCWWTHLVALLPVVLLL